MEEKKVNYKIMAFNSDGSLIDHYENCEVFVVVEDVGRVVHKDINIARVMI